MDTRGAPNVFSFRSKLFLISVVLILGFIALSGAYLDVSLRGWLERRIESDLLRQASLVEQSLVLIGPRWTSSELDPLLDELGRASDTRITLIAANGAVLGDSHLNLDEVMIAPNHGDRPEVLMAYSHGTGRARRFSETVNRDMLFVTVSLDQNQESSPPRVLRVAISAEEVDEAMSRVRLLILIAAIFGLAAAVVMSGVASELMSRTLRDLIEHARRASERSERSKKSWSRDKYAPHEANSQAGSVGRLSGELERVVATLATERDRFEAVLEGMYEAVIAIDREQRITLFNRAAQTLLGLNEASNGELFEVAVQGPSLRDLLPDRGQNEARTTEFELPGLTPRKVLARSAPQRTGAGTVIVMHDVTDLRRLETIRRDFVANVSHELRTPVTVIQANAETLLDGAIDDSRHAHGFVDAIHRNAERLSRLIADLLDISRLEAEQYGFVLEAIGIADVARQAAQTVIEKGEQPETRVEIHIPADHAVRADLKALDQILLNLIDNAVKYAPSGSLVEVVSINEGDEVLIEVRDNGPGIAGVHHSRIFERFYRVDQGRSSHMGGTGLGLSIVKHLVTAMGGHVGYRPHAPKGSVFWFRLPRLDAPIDLGVSPDGRQND